MSGLKSNHASAVRFSPYKVKLRLAGNDEIKFKTVLQDQRNESDRACARAMFCWPVSCDEFFFSSWHLSTALLTANHLPGAREKK